MRIGVDIGGTNLVAGLVDDNFNLVDKVDTPANATRPVLLYAYMEATGGKGDYAYAVTIATLVFFVVLILTALVQRISNKD